jgi:hypothetical protein
MLPQAALNHTQVDSDLDQSPRHFTVTCSITLSNSSSNLSHVIVNFSRRRAHNESADRVSCNSNVTESPCIWKGKDESARGQIATTKVRIPTKDVDFAVCNDNAGACRVLNGVLRLSANASYATNRTRQMIALERLHVRNFESL